MSEQPRILLFGAGSVGAVYIHILQRAGCHVTAVCRSNHTAVSANGFRIIDSPRFGHDVSFMPDAVVRSPAEACITGCGSSDGASGEFDFILICSKSFPDANPPIADVIRPAVTEGHTAIVLVQNGIGIEEAIADEFPRNPILSTVVYLPATQVEDGVVRQPEELNMLEIGTFPAVGVPAEHKRACETLAALIKRGGGDASVHDDIQPLRWAKLIVNASWNPICALSLCSDAEFLGSSTFAEGFVWGVMLEIVKIAEHLGIRGVDEEKARMQLARATSRVKGVEPSMLADVRAGRAFEVEAIVGNTVRIARGEGVKVPLLEAVYALAKGRYEAVVGGWVGGGGKVV